MDRTDAALARDAGPAVPDAAMGSARLVLDETRGDFGTVGVGCVAPTTVTFHARNVGPASTGALGIVISDGFVASMDGCSGRVLPAGGTCSVDVRFQPRQFGTNSGTLVLRAEPGGSVQVRLVGTGVPSDNIAIVSPTSYDFGAAMVGVTSGAATFTLFNRGGGPIAVSASVTDPDFLIVRDGCSGVMLVPGQRCPLEVAFRPSSSGARSGTPSVAAKGAAGGCGSSRPVSATLQGRGLKGPVNLGISRPGHDFGVGIIGCLEPPAPPFRITNLGVDAIGPLSVSITGPFEADSDGCSDTELAPGASCEVALAFRPEDVAVMGTLVVSGSGGEIRATLWGKGATAVAPSFDMTMQSYFGPVMVGTKSPPHDFTLRNNSDRTLGLSDPELRGRDSDSFVIVGNTCGDSLAARGTCRITVVFVPNFRGKRSANLVVEPNCGGNAELVLSGDGL